MMRVADAGGSDVPLYHCDEGLRAWASPFADHARAVQLEDG